VEELDRRLHGVLERLLTAPLSTGGVVVAQLDPGPGRQRLHRSDEVEVLDLPDERDRVTRRLATEAEIEALLGVDRERRRLFGVEGAQPHVPPTLALQRDVFACDRDEIGLGPHPGHVLVEDGHRTTVPPRRPVRGQAVE